MPEESQVTLALPMNAIVSRKKRRRIYMAVSVVLVCIGFVVVFRISSLPIAFAAFMTLPLAPIALELILRKALWDLLPWTCPACKGANLLKFIDAKVDKGHVFLESCDKCEKSVWIEMI